MKKTKSTVGSQIRAYRRTHGLTLRAMAEIVGVSWSTLQHLECGRTAHPTVATLVKLEYHIEDVFREYALGCFKSKPGRPKLVKCVCRGSRNQLLPSVPLLNPALNEIYDPADYVDLEEP
jgi:DNA-binding XRE family transcriptional regulator